MKWKYSLNNNLCYEQDQMIYLFFFVFFYGSDMVFCIGFNNNNFFFFYVVYEIVLQINFKFYLGFINSVMRRFISGYII